LHFLQTVLFSSLPKILIPKGIKIPVLKACGRKVFTDRKIAAALAARRGESVRSLPIEDIRNALSSLGAILP
jgi:hypothetical protein